MGVTITDLVDGEPGMPVLPKKHIQDKIRTACQATFLDSTCLLCFNFYPENKCPDKFIIHYLTFCIIFSATSLSGFSGLKPVPPSWTSSKGLKVNIAF